MNPLRYKISFLASLILMPVTDLGHMSCLGFCCQKAHKWNEEKNEPLKEERQISFEEVVFYIAQGFLLDVLEHPSQAKYQGQKAFVVQIDDYAYLVPFVEDEREIFLKTIIPSRKATKKYLKGSEE